MCNIIRRRQSAMASRPEEDGRGGAPKKLPCCMQDNSIVKERPVGSQEMSLKCQVTALKQTTDQLLIPAECTDQPGPNNIPVYLAACKPIAHARSEAGDTGYVARALTYIVQIKPIAGAKQSAGDTKHVDTFASGVMRQPTSLRKPSTCHSAALLNSGCCRCCWDTGCCCCCWDTLTASYRGNSFQQCSRDHND